MHVAMSWIMGLAMLGQRGKLVDTVVVLTVFAITISTLFVKQHLLVDVITGGALGVASWKLVQRARVGPPPSLSDSRHRPFRTSRRTDDRRSYVFPSGLLAALTRVSKSPRSAACIARRTRGAPGALACADRLGR